MTFLHLLRQSRLLSEPQLADVAARFPGVEAAETVAAALADEALLTPFQARELLAGRAGGLVLGQYRLVGEVGKGGFGRVYKAVHAIMGRVVAVKVISPELVENSRARDWFRREVLAATQLCHPNVVMAYDANEADGALFLVMEYVDGPDLNTLVRDRGPLPIDLACEMLAQAGRALQCAHEKGMVHRDVKPANLLVPREALAGPTGSGPVPGAAPVLVKVADFGLARLHGAASVNTLQVQTEQSFVGTPAFVSPEQARDVHAADIRSDLYSLGCTFYYAFTGRRPFAGDNVIGVLLKHLEEEPEPLESLRPAVPAAVAAAVRRLMAKEPRDRFQTPAELLAALGAAGPGPPRHVADGRAAPPRENIPATVIVSGPSREPTPELESSADVLVATALPLPAPATGRATAAESGTTELPAPAPPPSDGEFRELWRRWSEVVAEFARGRRPRAHEPAYRALHQALLAGCRSRAGAADGEERTFFLRLEGLVEPWLTPGTLASTDRTTLDDLLRRCRQAERVMAGPRAAFPFGRWAAVLAASAAAGALAWGWGRLSRGTLPDRLSADSLLALLAAHPVLASAAVVLFVSVASILWLSRAPRT